MGKSLFFLATLAGCAWHTAAIATTKTWSNVGGNNNWSTAGNWTPSGALTDGAPGDAIVFDSTHGTPIIVNLDFVTFTPASITFENSINTKFSANPGLGVFTVGAPASCAELFSTLCLEVSGSAALH